MRKWLAPLGGILWVTFAVSHADAAEVAVATVAELTTAIGAAQPGDTIVLEDGAYAATGFTCARSGTAAAPITVRGRTPLGAKLQLNALEGFKVSGAHWHFEDLAVQGVCANDSDCEHAFHVFGAADGFVLRRCKLYDFNAQLKVNSSQDMGGAWLTPHRGLIEGCELYDTRARNTANPTTKLNIDTGDDWILRANYIHDFQKGGGDNVSYGSFLKGGGKRGLVERNLVICSQLHSGGTRIGLSFGGGGTAPQFCAPAFTAAVPCNVEHDGGTMRNNVLVNCSDVGIYLNRGKDSHILYNTLIATGGVDFRFDTTTGEARGNALTGVVRLRDAATGTFANNLENIALATWSGYYQAPLTGDLRKKGDLAALLGMGPTLATVLDDYCARPRPAAGPYDVGAIQQSLGDCDTTRPPLPGPGNSGGSPDGGTTGGGGDQPPAQSEGCACAIGPTSATREPYTPLAALFVALIFFVLHGRTRADAWRRLAEKRPRWPHIIALAPAIVGCGKQAPAMPSAGIRAPAMLPPGAPSADDPPTAAPGAVVVRWATGHGDAIVARCKPGERLLGGGCDGGSSTSYPSVPVDFQPGDTIAAGWKCDFFGLESPRLVAYAMCQGVAPTSSSTSSLAPDANRDPPARP